MAKDYIQTNISSVQQSVERANGLANAHYIDPAVFAEESEAVLKATWAGLAVGADVPNPSDAKPIQFLGMPLLLLRDKDGELRVFENICRHRGMQLVHEAKTIEGAIRCPYHSWCYSTKGKLVSPPHVGGAGHNTHPSIVKDDLGLNEVRSYVWRDVVFINISGAAPEFTEVHADLVARWSEFDSPLYHGGRTAGLSWRSRQITNWRWKIIAKAIICLGCIRGSIAIRGWKTTTTSSNTANSLDRVRWFTGNLRRRMARLPFQIFRVYLRNGTKVRNILPSTPMSFWACSGITPLPSCLNRKRMIKWLSISTCTMPPTTPRRKIAW